MHIGCVYAASFRLYSVIQTCRHRDTLEHHYCTRNMQLRKPLSHLRTTHTHIDIQIKSEEEGEERESMFSPVSPWLYKRHVLKINPAVKRVYVCVCVCARVCLCECMHVCTDGQIHTQPEIHVHRLIWLNANTNTNTHTHMPASSCSLWLPRRHSFLQLKRSKALAPHTHFSLPRYFLKSVC